MHMLWTFLNLFCVNASLRQKEDCAYRSIVPGGADECDDGRKPVDDHAAKEKHLQFMTQTKCMTCATEKSLLLNTLLLSCMYYYLNIVVKLIHMTKQ